MKSLMILGLILANLAFVLLSNIGFKWSALSTGWQGFLWWQLAGNLAGFLSVLTFTSLLRLIPLHVAYAISAGFGFVLVQVVGAHLIFQETITKSQWLGSALVTLGIIVISLGR